MVAQGMLFTLKSLPNGAAGRSSPSSFTQVRNPLILNLVYVDRLSRSIGPVTGEHEASESYRAVRDFLLSSRHPPFLNPSFYDGTSPEVGNLDGECLVPWKRVGASHPATTRRWARGFGRGQKSR